MGQPICGQASSWGDRRSSSGGLATLCPPLCTLVHSGDSGHSIASYHLLPAPAQPLPPLGHGLVILQRHPQLLQCRWAKNQHLPGLGGERVRSASYTTLPCTEDQSKKQGPP